MVLNSFLHVIIIISSLNDATGSSVRFCNASKPSIKRRRQASINQVEYKGIMNAHVKLWHCRIVCGIKLGMMRQHKTLYFPHITDYNLYQAFSFKMMHNRFFYAIVFEFE